VSYYDQMKPVEQDQALTGKALAQFKRLVKDYPQSRYASDALAKIDICRGRLAQKELFIAHYYYDQQDNTAAARQRLEGILKNYQHTLVIPETLFLLAEVNFRERGPPRRGRCSAGWPPSMPTPSGKARRPAPIGLQVIRCHTTSSTCAPTR